MGKWYSFGFALVLIGIISLLYGWVYDRNLLIGFIFLIAGIVVVMGRANKRNEEPSFWCRIGFHQYELVGRDEDLNSRMMYQCTRCEKKKKVFRAL